MTRLPTLLARFAPLALQLLLRALPRQLTALLSRQRRIRGRRHRTVARGAVHLPLKLLDPLLQPRHLAQRIKQPNNQRPCGLPTSHRDRFRLDPIHDRKIPSIQKESCSPPRHHLNAYVPWRRRVDATLRLLSRSNVSESTNHRYLVTGAYGCIGAWFGAPARGRRPGRSRI
jgi:hypothetical protein